MKVKLELDDGAMTEIKVALRARLTILESLISRARRSERLELNRRRQKVVEVMTQINNQPIEA